MFFPLSRWPSSRRLALFPCLIAFILLATSTQSVFAGSFTTQTYNGRNYKIYVPSSYTGNTAVPLIVMLHGCTQDPDQFATGTEMNSYADSGNFIVIYPEQPSSAHSNKCWHWFDPFHQSRGSGEPALIAGMANQVKSNYNIDDDKVYVAGLSAGAAMSVIMGATYPDVFAAIGVGSGLEYKAATSESGAWNVMFNGGPNPVTQGNAAYNAMGSHARVMPTIVFHGTSDWTVRPINGDQIISQYAQTNDRADDGSDNNSINDTADLTIPGSVPGGRSYTRYVYEDTNDENVMEKYVVDSMGHAWSGGSSAGSYTDPNGPEASQIMIDFFLAHPMGGAGDTTPPVTTASPAGGTYNDSVTVTLSVNETAVTYYTTDGSTPTTSSAQYSSPLTFTTNATLKFFSVDSANNSEAVKTESYTIQTSGPDTTPPITTAAPAGGSYESLVTVTLSVNETAVTYYTTDGSTPTTSSAQYSNPLTFTADTTLKFFSVDSASNSEAVKTESYVITEPSASEMTFASIATQDGYVGIYTADGLSTSTHKLGDKGMYNHDTYRTILSFDTSALPHGATITAVTLRITQQTKSGTINTITAEVKNGTFGTSSLQQTDYSAAASGSWGTMPLPSGNNQSADLVVGSGGFQYINLTGTTQVRLKATTPIDFTSDVLTIYGGENSTYAPVLIVIYEE